MHAVSPCAHLVCRDCWDGSDFSACPICHRRIDPGDPFLRPTKNRTPGGEPGHLLGRDPAPAVATLLSPCDDPVESARDLLQALLARQTPLRYEDRAAVAVLVEDFWPMSADWLPERIPVSETRAVALAAAVRGGAHAAPDLLDRHLRTATDVLRLLVTLMGGDPGMRERLPRRISLPRPMRRALLARLDRMAVPYLVEDMCRYPEAWKRMAEVLHPFESHRRHPNAALAFAAVRGTRLNAESAFGRHLLQHAAGHPEAVTFDGVRLRRVSFAGRIEAAMRDGDHASALGLLVRRPGELARRLAHMARHVPAEGLVTAVTRTAPRVSPGVLVAALGQLRTPPGGTRMFLPRGGLAQAWIEPDDREPVPAQTINDVSAVIVSEMVRRASALPAINRAVLDEELADLLVPIAERSVSSALVRLPRGSIRPLSTGDRIRLFLHWMEPKDQRVDLDLSVALFDEKWQFIALCDYTKLRLADTAAVHSGDLTSAPEPLGASEFVDLDISRLRAVGGHYAVPVVFSFNDIPFEQLSRGFAGFLDSPGELFDPVAVRQRFDLTGSAKILVPFVADLRSRKMRWIDLHLSAAQGFHNLYSHHTEIARLCSSLEEVFGFGDRATLWELASWHAAGRSADVLVRHRDGGTSRYLRGRDEPIGDFAARLSSLGTPDERRSTVPRVDFAAVIKDDLELADGARVYALHPRNLDTTKVRLLDALDLLSPLSPCDTTLPP